MTTDFDFDEHVLGYIKGCEHEYLKGNKAELFEALLLCAKLESTPMPRWVAEAIEKAITGWEDCEYRTLDEAFDVSRPKGFDLNANRNKILNAFKSSALIVKYRLKGHAVNAMLFDTVAQELGMSASVVKRYWYDPSNLAQYNTDWVLDEEPKPEWDEGPQPQVDYTKFPKLLKR